MDRRSPGEAQQDESSRWPWMAPPAPPQPEAGATVSPEPATPPVSEPAPLDQPAPWEARQADSSPDLPDPQPAPWAQSAQPHAPWTQPPAPWERQPAIEARDDEPGPAEQHLAPWELPPPPEGASASPSGLHQQPAPWEVPFEREVSPWQETPAAASVALAAETDPDPYDEAAPVVDDLVRQQPGQDRPVATEELTLELGEHQRTDRPSVFGQAFAPVANDEQPGESSSDAPPPDGSLWAQPTVEGSMPVAFDLPTASVDPDPLDWPPIPVDFTGAVETTAEPAAPEDAAVQDYEPEPSPAPEASEQPRPGEQHDASASAPELDQEAFERERREFVRRYVAMAFAPDEPAPTTEPEPEQAQPPADEDWASWLAQSVEVTGEAAHDQQQAAESDLPSEPALDEERIEERLAGLAEEQEADEPASIADEALVTVPTEVEPEPAEEAEPVTLAAEADQLPTQAQQDGWQRLAPESQGTRRYEELLEERLAQLSQPRHSDRPTFGRVSSMAHQGDGFADASTERDERSRFMPGRPTHVAAGGQTAGMQPAAWQSASLTVVVAFAVVGLVVILLAMFTTVFA